VNLRERILAEIERREQVASPEHFRGREWVGVTDGERALVTTDDAATDYVVGCYDDRELATFIGEQSPADALRRYAHYRKVLVRHVPCASEPSCLHDRSGYLEAPRTCCRCGSALAPCADVIDVSDALGLSTEEDR